MYAAWSRLTRLLSLKSPARWKYAQSFAVRLVKVSMVLGRTEFILTDLAALSLARNNSLVQDRMLDK